MIASTNQARNLINELNSNSRKALSYFQKKGYDIYFSYELGCYVRKYVESNCEVVEPLINELEPAIDYYIKDFLPSWGKNDWCLEYLENLQHSETFKGFDVLCFIFKDICNLQASDSVLLKELQAGNAKRLKLIDSQLAPKIGEKYMRDEYIYDEQIINAMKSSNLVAIQSQAFHESSLHFVDKKLTPIIMNLDNELTKSNLYGILRVSSGFRFIMQQRLYKELGYPALDFSYHNLGLAFDLALSHEKFKSSNLPEGWDYYIKRLQKNEYQMFSKYLQEGISFSQLFKLYTGSYDKNCSEYTNSKIAKINKLAIQDIPLNLETLVKEGILNAKEPLIRIYNILKKQIMIKVIDETPFFSINNKAYTDCKKNLIRSKFLLPVLHCQLSSKDF